MARPTFKRVLIAVRPQERGLPLAAVHGRYLAERLDAELALVSCIYDSSVALRLGRGEPEAIAAQAGLVRNEEQALEKIAGSLRDWGARVTTRIVWDQPVYEGLLRAAREWSADLIVLGAHEPRLGAHLTRLTATDWQLMRLTPCPLLLVKAPDFEGYETILAAVDPLHRHAEPSGLDRAVLATARELSRALEATLRVVHVYPEPNDYTWASAVEVLPGVFYGSENIESLHRQAVLELATAYGVGADRVDTRPGKPAQVIAEVAAERQAKLVVIGAVQRSRLELALLGSTAEVVSVEAPCDVLLVPAPPASR